MNRYQYTWPTPSMSSSSSFVALLAILFIGLRLTGFIHWSWLWVLSPIWISFAIFLVSVVLAVALVAFRESRR